MTDDVNDVANINWLQALAKDYLNNKKKDRRRKVFYKILFVVVLLLAILFARSGEINKDKAHIAVIDVKGAIFDGVSASAKNIIKGLHNAYAAKGMKAVMLRINSPGGTPVQADYVYQEVDRLKKKYPAIKVYAVCTEMCASAAYYIASSADEIYASRMSLVGSIGVLYNGFGFVGAMDKLGISRRLITAGKNKGFLDPFSPQTPEDKEKLHTMLAIVHSQFEKSVLAGRGNRLKVTDETFSGLFWTGEQAKPMGLIDGFASPEDIAREKTTTGIAINYTINDSVFDRLSKQLTSSVLAGIVEQVGLNATLH